MLTYQKQNILDVQSGIICHQTNCRRVANAGLARQIRLAYPEWYTQFMKTVPRLGEISVFNPSQALSIINLYAQYNYGRDPNVKYTDEKAFESCVAAVATYAVYHEITAIYFPFNIGCGLGHGDWTIIAEIIEQYIPHAIICKTFVE